ADFTRTQDLPPTLQSLLHVPHPTRRLRNNPQPPLGAPSDHPGRPEVRSRPLPLRRCLLVFFFSSRRRHTRFSRDWSSDVCSSDLRSRRNSGGIGARLPGDLPARPSPIPPTNSFAHSGSRAVLPWLPRPKMRRRTP